MLTNCNTMYRGFSLRSLLNMASAEAMLGRHINAIGLLVAARAIARCGNTQRMKATAVHCTAAIQALLPEALEDYILSAECDDLFRPVSLEGML